MSAASVLDTLLSDLDNHRWPLDAREATTDELALLEHQVATLARVLRAIVKRPGGLVSYEDRWAIPRVVSILEAAQAQLGRNDEHSEAAILGRIVDELRLT